MVNFVWTFCRELALREELIRQEKLEQLAARFNRKASMRETWLSENQRLVSQVGHFYWIWEWFVVPVDRDDDVFRYRITSGSISLLLKLQPRNMKPLKPTSSLMKNVSKLWLLSVKNWKLRIITTLIESTRGRVDYKCWSKYSKNLCDTRSPMNFLAFF